MYAETILVVVVATANRTTPLPVDSHVSVKEVSSKLILAHFRRVGHLHPIALDSIRRSLSSLSNQRLWYNGCLRRNRRYHCYTRQQTNLLRLLVRKGLH